MGWWLTLTRRGDPGFEIGLDATRRDAANADSEHGVDARRYDPVVRHGWAAVLAVVLALVGCAGKAGWAKGAGSRRGHEGGVQLHATRDCGRER